MSLFRIFDISGSALHAQSVRLNTTASNMANMDSISSSTSQTYRAREPVFAAQLDEAVDGIAGVSVLGIVESDKPLRQEYRPDHPLADAKGYVNLPNVNPVEEMANMISASRAYQANVEVLNTSKQMMMRTLALGE
ncbi:MAG TPA: flagellar basal body rod protein FlgC [Candidatus Competibacteraceae bacterium]|nr:flagellar basal body rod protein FlgC [Candidatus Competibacteraceae bacterium]MCP5132248.1 flagellar basal body rod protein FlgC [Gammaproteobacteria bacterium]HPF59206.1 flagellar basal body rod protein FlgC [Candidatus Competibacteraceae bacterium]HRY17658.1 flagellar basal body rod protein FlgC [Candidatus Competibacteraceae bacterium]